MTARIYSRKRERETRSSQHASRLLRDSMLPEKAILSQKPHSERAAETVAFMLASDVDLAIQYQVEIVLPGLFCVTVNPVRIPLDFNPPVFVVRDVQTRIHNGFVVQCDRAV